MEEAKPCRHEYIKIYQRRLKGLERRLVGTKAYLPVGFKMADFKHLSEGSFCFCTRCRKRLFPKATQAEKELARIERRREKEEKAKAELEALKTGSGLFGVGDNNDNDDGDDGDPNDVGFTISLKGRPPVPAADDDDDEEEDDDSGDAKDESSDDSEDSDVDVSVDELEVESVDVDDIKAEGVKLSGDDDFDQSCDLSDEDA